MSDNEIWRYPRFFVNMHIEHSQHIQIDSDDQKHALSVLRIKKGEKAIICGKNSLEGVGIYTGDNGIFEITEFRKCENELDVKIRLFQCSPKSDKMDLIVQKAVELGAAEIIPVISERCVSVPDEKSAKNKTTRFKKIATEAAKQCGRGIIPNVEDYVKLKAVFGMIDKKSLNIIFYEGGGKKVKDIFSECCSQNKINTINILIGSEGGFSSSEVSEANAAGFINATLGKLILRCETAPIVALAIIKEYI